MKKTVKTTLIICTVVNNVKQTIEVVPFSNVEDSAKFCEFVMEFEGMVHEMFLGKETEVEFDSDGQVIRLHDKTDNNVIIEIKVDIRKDFEVTGEVVED